MMCSACIALSVLCGPGIAGRGCRGPRIALGCDRSRWPAAGGLTMPESTNGPAHPQSTHQLCIAGTRWDCILGPARGASRAATNSASTGAARIEENSCAACACAWCPRRAIFSGPGAVTRTGYPGLIGIVI
eukprot:scaffold1714_cov111-Isochrysis_galbana.AAC.8